MNYDTFRAEFTAHLVEDFARKGVIDATIVKGYKDGDINHVAISFNKDKKVSNGIADLPNNQKDK